MINDYYHDNKQLPVYIRQSTRLDTLEMADILLDPNMMEGRICSIPPVNIEHNVIFVVDLSKLKNIRDIFCDDMGSWKYNGIFKTWIQSDDNGLVHCGKKKPSDVGVYYFITKKYFVHKTSQDLKKIVMMIAGLSNFPCISNYAH